MYNADNVAKRFFAITDIINGELSKIILEEYNIFSNDPHKDPILSNDMKLMLYGMWETRYMVHSNCHQFRD